MFQFAHGPLPGLCVQPAVSRHHSGGVAPFGYSGLLARMQLPLNVSPVSASFIGLQRRGIHLVLSCACAKPSMWLTHPHIHAGSVPNPLPPLLLPLLPPLGHSLLIRSRLALGKIEVIMSFSCKCTRQAPLTTGKWKTASQHLPVSCPSSRLHRYRWRRPTWEMDLSDDRPYVPR